MKEILKKVLSGISNFLFFIWKGWQKLKSKLNTEKPLSQLIIIIGNLFFGVFQGIYLLIVLAIFISLSNDIFQKSPEDKLKEEIRLQELDKVKAQKKQEALIEQKKLEEEQKKQEEEQKRKEAAEQERQIELEKQSQENYKNNANSYSYKQLARNPNNYRGQVVTFTGEIIQVIDHAHFRVNVTYTDYTWTDTVFLTFYNTTNNERLLEGDVITFWGEFQGIKAYTSIMGTNVEIPAINARYVSINE